MTPSRLSLAAAASLALAAAAHAGANHHHAASPFGWLAGLAGHCWQAENPHASGKVEACWSFDVAAQTLRLRTRDAAGVTVQATVRVQHGWLVFQAAGRDGAPSQQCVLHSGAHYSFDGISPRPDALICNIVDRRSATQAMPPTWTYRLEPVAHDRYRIIETYQYGGGARAFRQHVWLFVRAGAEAARVDRDGDGDGDDSDAGCDGGVATPAAATRGGA